jgi:hypothetical protein
VRLVSIALLLALIPAVPAAAQDAPLPPDAVAQVGEELISRSDYDAWFAPIHWVSRELTAQRQHRALERFTTRFRARYMAITVCAEGYVVSTCGSASPNGVPSESRHTDQASPGWITLPPSAATRSSASAISDTSK